MNLLIIGGAGFAGSGLARKFLGKGYKVGIIDIVSPYIAYNLTSVIDNPMLHYTWKAMRDIEVEDLKGWETVVHLAAQADVTMGITSPRWTIMDNVEETICLLETVRKLEVKPDKIIYASSGNVFGRPVYLPIDENHPLTPHNPYAFSKAAAEMSYMAYSRCYDLPVTIMSNGACLGPGMRRDIFVYKWLRNIIKSLPVVLEGGDQTRDLTYVSDILDGWGLVIEADPKLVRNEKFQISYGTELTVEDILRMCFDVAGKNVPVIHRDYRPGEKGQREFFTNMKARRVLGYNPVINPYMGIQLTYDWMMTLGADL